MITKTDTFTHNEQGKTWELPIVLAFGTRFHEHQFRGNYVKIPNYCQYEVIGYRKPKQGEWCITGTKNTRIVQQAGDDLSLEYLIIRPTIERTEKTITIYT